MGLSMGGTLVLRLAEQRGADVAGVVVVNASLFTTRKDAKLLPLLRHVVPSLPPIGNDIKKPGVTEPAYDRLPVEGGVPALEALGGHQRRPRHDHPAAAGADQPRRPRRRAGELRAADERAGSADKRQVWLEDSFHVATLDNDLPRHRRGVAGVRRAHSQPATAATWSSTGTGPRSGARDNGLRCAGYVADRRLRPAGRRCRCSSAPRTRASRRTSRRPRPRGGYLEVTAARRGRPTGCTSTSPSARPRALAELARADAPDDDVAGANHAAPPQRTRASTSTRPGSSCWRRCSRAAAPRAGAGRPARTSPSDRERTTPMRSLPLDRPRRRPERRRRALRAAAPPPLPRLRRVTVIALLAILAGLIVLATSFDGGSLVWLASLAIIGGRRHADLAREGGPPTDSGSDDGAVV